MELGTYDEIKSKLLYWGIVEEEAARHHKEGCRFRLAVLGAVSVACDCHGRDVCPEKDLCDCGRGNEVFLNYLKDLEDLRAFSELDMFIKAGLKGWLPKSQYIHLPGFSAAYMRIGQRVLNDGQPHKAVSFANLSAVAPGGGAFTRALEHVKKWWPDLAISVECVQTTQFAAGLLKRGFEELKHVPHDFVLPAGKKDKDKGDE